MADSLIGLRRRIKTTDDLQAVVKTMKAMSAASIASFEEAVTSLREYHSTVEFALSVWFRSTDSPPARDDSSLPTGLLVIGTDQGMVGQFNEQLVNDVVDRVTRTETPAAIWTVGERVQMRLENAGFEVARVFPTPSSVNAITPLVTEMLLEMENCREQSKVGAIFQAYNRPDVWGAYENEYTQLLPLSDQWRERKRSLPWPTKLLPEIILPNPDDLPTLIREYLFTSLFKACAESCAAENAARLAAMQLAEKNIDERRRLLDLVFKQQRQTTIDEELFDLVSGFEALKRRD